MLRNILNFFRSDAPVSRSLALEAGDLVSVESDNDLFAVAKILVKDAHGVHVRLYVQRFNERPLQVNVTDLDTAPYGPDHDFPFSIGHMPLAFPSFDTWQPELISRGNPVIEEELVGYRIWQEGGGYF